MRREPPDWWRECFEAAGVAGVEPWGYSLRELRWMADGRERRAWDRAGAVCYTVARLMGARKATPADFDFWTRLKEARDG